MRNEKECELAKTADPVLRLFYAQERLPDRVTCSLFLMGPSTSGELGRAASWRDEALANLEELDFHGEVFIPERRPGREPSGDDEKLLDWMEAALRQSDWILVWLAGEGPPSSRAAAIGDWRYWMGRDPARLILAVPPNSCHAADVRHAARQAGLPLYSTLAEACRAAAAETGEPRSGGECQVPLHIWRSESFQAWYRSQQAAGNTLCGANVEWVFRVGQQVLLYWALHVDMYVASESRHKTNEVVIGRGDIAAVLLYHSGRDLLDTQVVLVREFRSSAATPDGLVWELPSGSSPGHEPMVEVAAAELKQECGFEIRSELLQPHESRQLAATTSTHKAHLFSFQLTDDQLAELRAREAAGVALGNAAETEATYLRIRSLREILVANDVDWSTIGMIVAVLQQLG